MVFLIVLLMIVVFALFFYIVSLKNYIVYLEDRILESENKQIEREENNVENNNSQEVSEQNEDSKKEMSETEIFFKQVENMTDAEKEEWIGKQIDLEMTLINVKKNGSIHGAFEIEETKKRYDIFGKINAFEIEKTKNKKGEVIPIKGIIEQIGRYGTINLVEGTIPINQELKNGGES